MSAANARIQCVKLCLQLVQITLGSHIQHLQHILKEISSTRWSGEALH